MAVDINLLRSQIACRAISVLFFATIMSFWFPFAAAQQPAKIPRIGYVSGTGNAANQGPYVEALRQGLRDFGYVEGKNFTIEYRGAEGKLDRVPSLVTELVQLKVDILVVPFNISSASSQTGDPDDSYYRDRG